VREYFIGFALHLEEEEENSSSRQRQFIKG